MQKRRVSCSYLHAHLPFSHPLAPQTICTVNDAGGPHARRLGPLFPRQHVALICCVPTEKELKVSSLISNEVFNFRENQAVCVTLANPQLKSEKIHPAAGMLGTSCTNFCFGESRRANCLQLVALPH